MLAPRCRTSPKEESGTGNSIPSSSRNSRRPSDIIFQRHFRSLSFYWRYSTLSFRSRSSPCSSEPFTACFRTPLSPSRRRNRWLRHRGIFYSRQIAYRLVPRPRRTEQRLRGGRRPYRAFALDLLLFPDFYIWPRNHQSDRRYGVHVGDNRIDRTFDRLNAKGTPAFSAR